MIGDIRSLPKDTTFLVTGGAGFIGSNIADELIGLGFKVIVYDNLSTGKLKNIEKIIRNDRFTFMLGDLRNYNRLDKAMHGVDYVIHHAAMISVHESMMSPIEYFEVNIRGTLNLFEIARNHNVKRVVYATSSAVYGNADAIPNVEGKESDVLSFYALSKKFNEDLAKFYWNAYGIPNVGLRYFNVFGTRQDPKSPYAAVIPKFINMLMNGQKPVIYGNGEQTRDFTYVDNIVEANLKACVAPEEANGEVFNIACGRTETINVVYQMIANALNVTTCPQYVEAREGDIFASSADISKARIVLCYEPICYLEEGIAKTVNWFKKIS